MGPLFFKALRFAIVSLNAQLSSNKNSCTEEAKRRNTNQFVSHYWPDFVNYDRNPDQYVYVIFSDKRARDVKVIEKAPFV